jgi:Sulfotransferase family
MAPMKNEPTTNGANERFVVVAGSPRSGTSLLRTILRKHDSLAVHATEPHYLLEMYGQFGATIKDVPRAIDFVAAHEKFPRQQVDPSALREAFAGRATVSLSEFLRTSYRIFKGDRQDRSMVLKHPAFVLHLDLIKSLFPNLTVVHSIRDPRGNVLSQRTRWPSTSVWKASTKWRACIDAGRAWQRKGLSPYLEVRYEDLVIAPEKTCASLCAFLGIPYTPELLAFDHVEREWNPTKPGEGAKRHYQGFEQQRIDKWKRHLKPVEVRLIEDRCRRRMEWFGYEPSDPQVDLGEYLPFYLQERRRAARKALTRMTRRWRGAVRAS